MNTPHAREHANTKSSFHFEPNGTLIVKDAAILFSNFAGNPDTYHPNGGNRVFNLVLSDQFADILKNEGWNVKGRENQDGDITYMTEIRVNMESNWPPMVVLYSEFRGRKTSTVLDVDSIGRLDSGRYSNIKMAINPHEHNVGQYKVKGYLRELRLIAEPENGYFSDMDDEYLAAESEHPMEAAGEELPFV